MNKHGFRGVRKRTDGRAKPYYARVTVRGGFVYTPSHETPEAAALEFERYAAALRNLAAAPMNTGGK